MDVPNDLVDSAARDNHKYICIIGGGPTGLAALKAIKDTDQYQAGIWHPTVYESREDIGGIWLPAAPTDDPPLTSLYDSLTTNIPHTVMAYSSFPFPPSTNLFPSAKVVLKYLQDYTSHFNLYPHIELGVTVESVKRIPNTETWSVRLYNGKTRTFDLILVCNGHYRQPRYPDAPGLKAWLQSGKASHSAWYRDPESFGNTILVVGAGPSGQDITSDMLASSRTVIHSIRDSKHEDMGNLKRRGRVVTFGSPTTGHVTFEDGTTETGIDHCILGTGYEASFPFFDEDVIRNAFPPPFPPLPRETYNSTYGVLPLAKYMFPLQPKSKHTSLAFLGMLIKIAPFPLTEAQARAALRAFAEPASIDETQEAIDIMTRHEVLRSRFGDDSSLIAKNWCKFEGKEQLDYRESLNDFAEAGGIPGVVRVAEWESGVYAKIHVLRKTWVELEKSGEADEWLKGVGENGVQDWLDLTKKVLERAEGQSRSETTEERSRL